MRGRLRLYCYEVRAGVFVGRLPRRVRESLWGEICESGPPYALMAASDASAQGLEFREHGTDPGKLSHQDGFALIEN